MTSDLGMNSVGVSASRQATVFAGDYLNKLSGEQIERECRLKLQEGCNEIVVNFSQTELVNSIGISILLGIIDSASANGARVIFSDVKHDTIELFDMLGVTKHVDVV
ncbi:MAG: STAS domain-containing protein [Pyrinomonadaceae bacterium]